MYEIIIEVLSKYSLNSLPFNMRCLYKESIELWNSVENYITGFLNMIENSAY